MKKLLEWLLSFFEPKKQGKLKDKIKMYEEGLKEIEDADHSDANIIDHFNK